jgi:hypothetical protein
MLVEDEGDPLGGWVAAFRLENVFFEEVEGRGGVSEGDIKFLS